MARQSSSNFVLSEEPSIKLYNALMNLHFHIGSINYTSKFVKHSKIVQFQEYITLHKGRKGLHPWNFSICFQKLMCLSSLKVSSHTKSAMKNSSLSNNIYKFGPEKHQGEKK